MIESEPIEWSRGYEITRMRIRGVKGRGFLAASLRAGIASWERDWL